MNDAGEQIETSIRDAWIRLSEGTYSSFTPKQILECKRAFYAGALQMCLISLGALSKKENVPWAKVMAEFMAFERETKE